MFCFSLTRDDFQLTHKFWYRKDSVNRLTNTNELNVKASNMKPAEAIKVILLFRFKVIPMFFRVFVKLFSDWNKIRCFFSTLLLLFTYLFSFFPNFRNPWRNLRCVGWEIRRNKLWNSIIYQLNSWVGVKRFSWLSFSSYKPSRFVLRIQRRPISLVLDRQHVCLFFEDK